MYKKIALSLLAITGLAQAIPEPLKKLKCGGKQLFVTENKCTILAQVKNVPEFKKLPVIRFINNWGKTCVFAEVTEDQLMHILEQPFVIIVHVLK